MRLTRYTAALPLPGESPTPQFSVRLNRVCGGWPSGLTLQRCQIVWSWSWGLPSQKKQRRAQIARGERALIKDLMEELEIMGGEHDPLP